MCVLVHRCLYNKAPPYLAETLHLTTEVDARRRLRSASTSTLITVPSTRRSTIGDRAFPVAAACAWNSLPSSVRTIVLSLNAFAARHSHWFSARQLTCMSSSCSHFVVKYVCSWPMILTIFISSIRRPLMHLLLTTRTAAASTHKSRSSRRWRSTCVEQSAAWPARTRYRLRTFYDTVENDRGFPGLTTS